MESVCANKEHVDIEMEGVNAESIRFRHEEKGRNIENIYIKKFNLFMVVVVLGMRMKR